MDKANIKTSKISLLRVFLPELNEEDMPVIKKPLDKTRGNNIQKISIIEFTNISSFLKFFYKLVYKQSHLKVTVALSFSRELS